MKKYPSIAALWAIKDCDAILARKILTAKNKEELATIRESGNFSQVDSWLRQCYNPPSFHNVKMAMLDVACHTFGVEYTPKGHNEKSPAIEYLNTGDTYNATLLFVNGSYRVGCWGDIVERGNYD